MAGDDTSCRSLKREGRNLKKCKFKIVQAVTPKTSDLQRSMKALKRDMQKQKRRVLPPIIQAAGAAPLAAPSRIQATVYYLG